MTPTRHLAVITGGLAVLTLAMTGCVGDSDDQSANNNDHAAGQVTEAGPADGDDGGNEAGLVISDGGQPVDGWDAPMCSNLDTYKSVLISSSTPDGGDLMVQWPLEGSSSSLVINLTLPGSDAELTNSSGGEAKEESEGVYTFTGKLTDNPHQPTATHEIDIKITCGS